MNQDPDIAARPSAGALLPLSPDRVNQQRDSSLSAAATSPIRILQPHDCDNAVLDKVSQFNSLAAQSRQLERRTADAALRRAMLGREEAESEMRRFRDENAALRKQVEEGKLRERRVGERLEAVMVRFKQNMFPP